MIESISDLEIKEARKVLEDHTVKHWTRESALESGIWCISSQATPWEIASGIVYALRDRSKEKTQGVYASWEVLTSKDIVNEVVREKNWRFAHNRRFDGLIDYVSSRGDNWWEEVLNAGRDQRDYWAENVRYMSRKTFSFWHLCLGGRDLLALDVHVMRGLSRLGVSVPVEYFQAQGRKVGTQKVRKTPNAQDYLRIESAARDLFSQDERFILPSGNVDLALADSVLWWKRANRGSKHQAYLFGEECLSSGMPYASSVVSAK